MAVTDFLALTKPTVGGDQDAWGDLLNADLDDIDGAIRALVEAGNYAEASGVDAIAVSLDPAPSAYAAGLLVRFKTAGANTAGPTLDVGGLGARAIKYRDGASIPAGGLAGGVIHTAEYNGTDFILAGPISASAAETLAGADAVRSLTPAGFAGNKALGANGYYQFPGGFTVQWGVSTSAIPGGSTFAATFPAAFANACVFACAVPRNPGGDVHEDIQGLQWKAASTTSASFFCQDGSQVNAGAVWMALGY